MILRRSTLLLVALSALAMVGCAAKPDSLSDSVVGDSEMTGSFEGELPTELFVEQSGVKVQYKEFVAELKALGQGVRTRRPLYEKYVPIIGANGVLAGITELWPTCHSEAHDLGKVIFASTNDIDTALRVCRDGCYSGCMHGVLMEAYAGARDTGDIDGHVTVDGNVVRTLMQDICEGKTMKDSYSPGDCAHATGHALMVLAEYDIDQSIAWCDEFSEEHMRYYCATGAYMEYITERDADDVKANKPILYPCESHKYPAACARYKMVHMIPRLVKGKTDVSKMQISCQHLKDPYRLGCFHGLGNGFVGPLAGGALTLEDVCGLGNEEERRMCVEGAMERMAKYSPDKADATCKRTDSGSDMRPICDDSVARGMYDMQKDLSLYVR